MTAQLNSTLTKPKPRLFWNPRGRVVEVSSTEDAPSLIRRGFVRCEPKAKPGDYNPVYDKGDVDTSSVISRDIPVPQGGATDYLKVIEV